MKVLIWCTAASFAAFWALFITAAVLYDGKAEPLGWNIATGAALGLTVTGGTAALAWRIARSR